MLRWKSPDLPFDDGEPGDLGRVQFAGHFTL